MRGSPTVWDLPHSGRRSAGCRTSRVKQYQLRIVARSSDIPPCTPADQPRRVIWLYPAECGSAAFLSMLRVSSRGRPVRLLKGLALRAATLDPPGCADRRNCIVYLDSLPGDRSGLLCELQPARGVPRNLQLNEPNVCPVRVKAALFA